MKYLIVGNSGREYQFDNYHDGEMTGKDAIVMTPCLFDGKIYEQGILMVSQVECLLENPLDTVTDVDYEDEPIKEEPKHVYAEDLGINPAATTRVTKEYTRNWHADEDIFGIEQGLK